MQITVAPKAKPKLLALNDEVYLAVKFELQKIGATNLLRKERVAVLNDKYDIYVLDASDHKIIVAHEPGSDSAMLVDLLLVNPTPHLAASSCAVALRVQFISVDIFGS